MNIKNLLRQRYLMTLSIILSVLSVSAMLFLSFQAYMEVPSQAFSGNLILEKYESLAPNEGYDRVLAAFIESTKVQLTLVTVMLVFMMSTLFAALVLLGSQMYLWQRDRRKLELWKNAGFLCESLEFLPANRIKLNNIELELNKTQYMNLLKLVNKRSDGDTLHVHDIGDHGAQSMKRLREELGARFIEKTLIKNRKQQGYWIDIEPCNIRNPE